MFDWKVQCYEMFTFSLQNIHLPVLTGVPFPEEDWSEDENIEEDWDCIEECRETEDE